MTDRSSPGPSGLPTICAEGYSCQGYSQPHRSTAWALFMQDSSTSQPWLRDSPPAQPKLWQSSLLWGLLWQDLLPLPFSSVSDLYHGLMVFPTCSRLLSFTFIRVSSPKRSPAGLIIPRPLFLKYSKSTCLVSCLTVEQHPLSLHKHNCVFTQ